MSFERTRFADYYVLNKDTFSIDPVEDAATYFGTGRLSERLRARIESDFAQARAVPKFFVYGAYGAGKTHTLFHIAYELKSNPLEKVRPIYIDIAPLKNKEKFSSVQGRLLDAIGLEAISQAAEKHASSIEGDKAEGIQKCFRHGDAALRSSQANVFRNVLFGGKPKQLSWEWLKGANLSSGDRDVVQVTKLLTQPSDYVAVLLNTAELIKQGLGEKIVFLIDEAEAFRDVLDPDSEAEFKFAFRQLTEDSNNVLGLIAAIQPEGGQGEIGSFFTDSAIQRRIGYQTGMFDLVSLFSQEIDSKKFIDDLLRYLVNQERARAICLEENLPCAPEHFPFQDSALDTLVNHISSDIEQQTPAGIIHNLASAAIAGWRLRQSAEQHITVDAGIMESVLYPEGA